MKKASKLLGLALAGGIIMTSFPVKAALYFRDTDRTVLHNYVTTLPAPESTVTFYNPGTVLPETITYTELPDSVTMKLTAPPTGNKFVAIGRNVYLINPEKRVIVDAIKLD